MLPQPFPAAPAGFKESRPHPASPGSTFQDRDQVKLLLNSSEGEVLEVPAKNEEGKTKQSLVQETQLLKNASPPSQRASGGARAFDQGSVVVF